MIEIKSTANPVLKRLRKTKSKKGRDETGLYLIEGKKTILEAYDCGASVAYLVLTRSDGELFVKAEKAHTEIILTSYETLRSLSDTKNPPDCLAYINITPRNVDMEAGVTVAMDGVADPYNAGTIIRTADAFGAAGVLSGVGGCGIYSPKVQRAAMGSMFHIAVEETDLAARLEKFKAGGGYIIATALDGEEKMPAVSGNVCLTVGNEGAGIGDRIKQLSDFIYKIPMRGRAESLNVGVACGIALFEIINQNRV